MPNHAKTPVVFVHGLWMHASSWDEWVGLFNDNGYQAIAPRWPGEAESAEATRKNPHTFDNRGIAEVTDHYSKVIADLPTPPILIGHSFGGLIAQRLFGLGFGRGCVAIAPAQFRGILGLPPAQLRAAWPVLSRPGLLKKTWSHTPETFHRFFANAVPRVESDRLLQAYGMPAPARPLFQAGLANLTIGRSEAAVDTHRDRGPLLLIAGGRDQYVPASVVRAAYKIQRRNSGRTEFKLFEDRGHSLAGDHGWRDIADTALEFLTRTGLSAKDSAA
ncbi:MAG TPA: alpha/beta fold hydrolase [Streptosporangiaceae bacterium]|jgi:pimeloyl-ACP methyl ester carboxylesterase